MTTPFTDCRARLTGLWDAHWTPVSGVPVFWHDNSNPAVPTDPETLHWLLLQAEWLDEIPVAFGAGPRAAERELYGVVRINVLARRGIGEDTVFSLLDAALDVYRGRNDGVLRFLGDSALRDTGASADGAWWIRSAIASFAYRFRG